MGLTAELSTQDSFESGFEGLSNGRKAERAEVALGAGLRQRGASAVTVQIIDLSITGFRAATHLVLEPGTDIWIKLPGLESLHGRVVWMRGHTLGGTFSRPLHPAVLDMIARS